jgi:hypothetical protein
MDLTTYLEGLRRDLTAAAAPGGPDVARAAELITGALDAPARLALLEALTDAAAEITSRLDGPSVEVRLRGRDAQFVVTQPAGPVPPPAEPPTAPPDAGSAPAADVDGDVTRLTLRMPEGLKAAVERAAAADGVSVNTWLVRAVNTVLTAPPAAPPGPPGAGWPGAPTWGRTGGPGHRITGYAQG